MPVLSLACHLPHNAPHIPWRYNYEQTTKQTKAINNSYIYINISCKCDTNRAGHLTLDAYASRPVACYVHCITLNSFTGTNCTCWWPGAISYWNTCRYRDGQAQVPCIYVYIHIHTGLPHHNRPLLQAPQCTCLLSHNAPFRTEICIFLFWMVHCGIWDRCIVGLRISQGCVYIYIQDCHIIIYHFYKPHNALVSYPTMHHSEQKCAHFCSE